MKITKSQLKKIIKEELSEMNRQSSGVDPKSYWRTDRFGNRLDNSGKIMVQTFSPSRTGSSIEVGDTVIAVNQRTMEGRGIVTKVEATGANGARYLEIEQQNEDGATKLVYSWDYDLEILTPRAPK